MVSQNIVITNPSGLHARPASVLAMAAGKCKSHVVMIYGEKEIQIKSVLSIMAAAVKKGAEVELRCEGATEEEDLKTLVALIESGLGE